MAKLLIFVCALLIATVSAKPRIVGGKNAAKDQFPHQMSIRMGSSLSHNCGGSILSEDWVLTAAHCVTDTNVKSYTIVAGDNSLSSGTQRKVKRIIAHESYGNFQNDIAIIQLEKPFVFSDSLNKIEVFKGVIPDGGKILISGWGRVSTNGQIPDHLQFNDNISKSSDSQCKSISGSIFYKGLICLNHKTNNGACFGDSGGPATYDDKLVGIANFVIGGCGTSSPDGYAYVPYFVDWINENAGSKIV